MGAFGRSAAIETELQESERGWLIDSVTLFYIRTIWNCHK